jgi:3-hydroxybutyryl-CoA dehydrogenase
MDRGTGNGETNPNRMERVAVIGAGLMGHGIAQVFAQNGCSVRLYDIAGGLLTRATERIRANLDLFVDTGVEDQGVFDRVLSRIKMTTDLREALDGAQFVTEAVLEDLDLKAEIFKQIDAATDENVVMASNTSTLSMSGIAKSIRKGDRLLVTHWFNPPHLIPVVEVLGTEVTGEATVKSTLAFLKEMGKEPVHVLKEVPGFLVNRIQTAMFREIMALLEAGVASAEDIDKAVSGSFGIRLAAIGPLATVDLAGVDLWYKGAKHLYPFFDNSTEPQKMWTEMVEKGLLGKEAGKGFFDYPLDCGTDIVKERDMRLIGLLDILRGSKIKGGC